MFNKEGIPFFSISVPFLVILFISFFSSSYFLKVTNESFEQELKDIKKVYVLITDKTKPSLEKIIKDKTIKHKEKQENFINFMKTISFVILSFMALFSLLMYSIITDVIKKYKTQVHTKELKLQNLNKTLEIKVQSGIEEGKRKDKAMFQQSRLARLGTMLSMIAHQWRQPLTQLSGVLMELETATRFKKVNDEHILTSVEKSDKLIEFMSNTIDDFRNFYKPDKKKEKFYVYTSCQKAISLISASLKAASIELILDVKDDKEILSYEREFSQVILNLISNARDILVEKKVQKPKIFLNIKKIKTNIIIEIKDNAGGIEEKYFDLIFDPYFSTKEASQGTGLGLYISKLIIEKNMSGVLSVKNDKEGALFKIVLGENYE